MRFEGILKEYLEAVATGFNRSGCRRFIHPKRGATATAVQSKSVRLGPVSGLFPVHATGPLNTNDKAKCDVGGDIRSQPT